MKNIITLPKKNLQSLHFYFENLSFPIVVGTYSLWEESQISYLNAHISDMKILDICNWCINHHICYQILYPISKNELFKNPLKFFFYLLLKHRIKKL